MSSNFRRMICHSCKKGNRNPTNSEAFPLNRMNTLSSNSTRFVNSYV